MRGVKHLIECRCILPTLKNRDNPPSHKFVVFSILDENDNVKEKMVSCNNCDINHLVYDICHSKIMTAEGTVATLTSEDISAMLPESVISVLETYDKTLPDYEHINFMINENKIEDFLVLTSDISDDKKVGKILRYKGENRFIIEPYSTSDIVT